MKNLVLAAVLSIAALVGSPARAVPIPDGTLSSAHLFNPVVTVSASGDTATYSVNGGSTYQISGLGGFLPASGGFGTLSGSILFPTATGMLMGESLPNLFTFGDGHGGSFVFSATGVSTRLFENIPGSITSGSVYLLGTTVDPGLGYDATNTSLTLTFNSTGGSPYTSSSTLAVPPVSLPIAVPVPEPMSLALLGMGLVVMGTVRRVASSGA